MRNGTAEHARNAIPVRNPAEAIPAPDATPPDPQVSEPFISELHLALAERSIENAARLRRLAFSATGSGDWTDFGGRPYLQSSGALKIAAALGVSLTNMQVEVVREEFDGMAVVRYVARTTARFLGREVDVEGVASSDDPFFSRKDGRPVALREINLNSLRKKAVTNAQGRAVKTVLGLGGVSWKELQEADVKKSAASAVSYSKASPKNGTKAKDDPSLVSPKDVLKALLDHVAAMEGGSFDGLLRRYTGFMGKDGKQRWARSLDEMSDSWVARTLEKIEREEVAEPEGPGVLAAQRV